MASNTTIARVISETQELIDLHCLRSALSLLERSHRDDPQETAFLYHLGALYYCYLGNGLEAKRWFQATLNSRETSKTDPRWRLKAYACENLMLLSLTYEEYEDHASQLKHLDPDNPILKEHRDWVQQTKETAQPWYKVLGGVAIMHHNPHNPIGATRHSECAATWHLFLSNYKKMRVPRHALRNALLGYYANLNQVVATAGQSRLDALGWDDPDEVIFMLEPLKRLLTAYLSENPDSPDVQELLNETERLFDMRIYKRRPTNLKGCTIIQGGTKSSHLMYPEHYHETCRQASGKICELSLLHATVDDGPVPGLGHQIVTLVYEWSANLSYEHADRLDTRARAFIACAIFDAATTAGLSCEAGPLWGKRPSWIIAGERTPVSLVKAGFDVANKTCFMQIGACITSPHGPRSSGQYAEQLILGFQSQFSRIKL